MRTFPKTALFLFCLGFGLAGCVAVKPEGKRFDVADFSRPEFFPILPWDPLHGWEAQATEAQTNGLSSIAECHFNMAGFVRPNPSSTKCIRKSLATIITWSNTPRT